MGSVGLVVAALRANTRCIVGLKGEGSSGHCHHLLLLLLQPNSMGGSRVEGSSGDFPAQRFPEPVQPSPFCSGRNTASTRHSAQHNPPRRLCDFIGTGGNRAVTIVLPTNQTLPTLFGPPHTWLHTGPGGFIMPSYQTSKQFKGISDGLFASK